MVRWTERMLGWVKEDRTASLKIQIKYSSGSPAISRFVQGQFSKYKAAERKKRREPDVEVFLNKQEKKHGVIRLLKWN